MSEMTKQKILQASITGAITSLISLPFQHPFDSLKTNMQSKQIGIIKASRKMYQLKKWRAFYNGFYLNCLRVVTKQGFRWPLWITWKGIITQYFCNYNILFQQTLTGFAISFSELIILCPFQRIKTWLMTTKNQQQTNLRNYFKTHKSILDLYAGFTPMLIRQGLSWSSFLISSSYFKQKWRIYKGYDEKYQLGFTDLMLISVPVALVNTFFIMPIDCIKTFYQQFQSSTKNVKLIDLLKKHGLNNISGLYLGWQAKIIQYMIQSSFTLTAFQAISHQYILQKKKMHANKQI